MTPEHTAELQALEAELATLRASLKRVRKATYSSWGEADEAEIGVQVRLELWNREHAARLAELRLMQVTVDPVGKGEKQ